MINQTNDPIADDYEPEESEEGKPTSHVPIDWSLKTKIRLLSTKPIPGSRLKSNEEASGITGYDIKFISLHFRKKKLKKCYKPQTVLYGALI